MWPMALHWLVVDAKASVVASVSTAPQAQAGLNETLPALQYSTVPEVSAIQRGRGRGRGGRGRGRGGRGGRKAPKDKMSQLAAYFV